MQTTCNFAPGRFIVCAQTSFDFGRSTMGVINVIDTSGRTHELEAVEGWRVMEIIREHGLPMQGTCGGACACATCHVVVDDGGRRNCILPAMTKKTCWTTCQT
jgi:ferredoxin